MVQMVQAMVYGLMTGLMFIIGCNAQTATPVITTTRVVTLYEDEAAVVILTSITCTDADGDDIVVSGTISPTSNCVNCFVVEPTVTPTVYELVYYPAVATLDFNSVAEYTVTLTCTDSALDATETVFVRLTPNSPPTFDAGLAVTTAFNNVKITLAGTVLHTVSASDPNGDPISFTMTSSPASSNFKISSDGMITAVNDLNQECNNIIVFEVLISDGKISNVGPQTISVTLNDANVAPTITNLNAAGNVPEDAVLGFSLFSLSTSDDDAAPTVSMTTFPSSAISFFTLVGSQLQVANTLDYESIQIRTTNIIFVADDGACTSPTYTYTLSVTDVNEVPNLDLSLNPQEIYEGDVSHDPSWVITDDDFGDIHTYSITGKTPSNSPFSIDINSGLIMSTTNYEIDQGVTTATVTLTVQITDSGGLTDSIEYIMHFKDTNDNNPVFTSGTQDLFFTITECTTIGTSLGSFSATDEDSAFQNNNVVEFSEVGTTTSGITIAPSGDVILNTVLAAGVSVTLDVQATDNGEHPGTLTSLVGGTVTVTSTACPTTTTPATPSTATVTAAVTTTTTTTTTLAPNTSTAESDNVWWIAMAGILATVFLGLTIFLCLTRMPMFCRAASAGHWLKNPVCNCKGRDLCKRRTNPKKAKIKDVAVKPQHEPPRNPPNNGNEGFWKERYPDDNYQQNPDRNKIPEPADLEAGPHRDALPWRNNPSPFVAGGKDNGRVWNNSSPFSAGGKDNGRIWTTNVNNTNGRGYGDGIL